MNFLAKGTTEKIVEDATEKREGLIRTFAVGPILLSGTLLFSHIYFLVILGALA